ncbi:hypothetical protein FOA52_012697 [Chlamydomonas sp. UWO 241]|nr:hypothetical protein FOA52_012697 [Chlamydomonas sp. UWO 241]
MDALWSNLETDDKRALRLCCTVIRDAVDAHASCLEEQGDAPVLSPTTCARLACVNTLSLRSMACLRGMLVESPQPGAFFPRLQSLRLILHEGGVAIEDPADYQAIAIAGALGWLTQLSLRPPASATALPQQMAALLSACGKLEDLRLHADGVRTLSRLADIGALAAAGTQLLRLSLLCCCSLSNLAPLSALANLQSLYINGCVGVSDLMPLTAVAKLQSLDLRGCITSDLAPLTSMVNLQSLDISNCYRLTDLTPRTVLVNSPSLDISGCKCVSSLASLTDLVNLHILKIDCSKVVHNPPIIAASDLAPLAAMVNIQSLNINGCSESKLALLRTLPPPLLLQY